MTEQLAAIAALVARHIVADAARSASGLISDEAAARRLSYYRSRVEARFPGAGDSVLRAAMGAALRFCELEAA